MELSFSKIKKFFLKDRFEESGKKSPPTTEKMDTSDMKSVLSVLGGPEGNPDEILKKKGVKIYDQMEEKDSHIYSVYQTRKLAIAMTPWDIYPADDSDRSKEIRNFVFMAIDDIKGPFSEDLKQLCDAIGKGFSILEIVWKLKEDGRWKGKYVIDELIFHKQKFWYFKDARWHKAEESVVLFGDRPMDAKPVSWEKIVYYAYDSDDSMYGKAAFRPIYWFYWFKKEGWKSWIVFLNKYGTPTAVGEYPTKALPAEQSKLLEIVERIQEETGIVIPTGTKLSFLEASHAGTASFKDLSDACNAEFSKAILGATQTVEEGKRGSYALSRAHSEVRRERVEADAVGLSDVVQEQIIRRLVDFNFITDIYPQFIMKTFAGKDTEVKEKKKAPIAKLPPAGPTPSEDEIKKLELPEDKEVKEKIAKKEIKKPEAEKKEKESIEEAIPEETSEKLNDAFKKIKTMISKSYLKNSTRKPVINVGMIKNTLLEKFGEEGAFDLAQKVKNYIEINIRPDSIDKVVDEARQELIGMISK